MDWAIANAEGFLFVLRWIHFIAGIIWIGHLYYFNFVQGEFYKEIDANTKNIALSKNTFRALAWFRYGALWTFISGALLIIGTLHTGIPLASSWGVLIYVGSLLGTLMFLNVWLVIWPNQKIVIASANSVLNGGAADPAAAAAGAKGLLASRTNVMFSIALLFFMGAARHLILARDFSVINIGMVFGLLAIPVVLLEINGLKGKLGPMTTVRGVIHCGVGLTAILYVLVELVTR